MIYGTNIQKSGQNANTGLAKNWPSLRENIEFHNKKTNAIALAKFLCYSKNVVQGLTTRLVGNNLDIFHSEESDSFLPLFFSTRI